MAKRRNNDLDLTEPITLNSEKKSEVLGEVREELLKEITEETVEEVSEENVETTEEVINEVVEKAEPTVNIETLTGDINSTTIVNDNEINTIKKGDNVKIMHGVTTDMFGKRIHNGIKNYVYVVGNVRTDGYCTVKCLNYSFTLPVNKLIKQ